MAEKVDEFIDKLQRMIRHMTPEIQLHAFKEALQRSVGETVFGTMRNRMSKKSERRKR